MKTVMFWRDGHWHVGWLQQLAPDFVEGSSWRVAWVKDDKVYSKIVDKVYPIDLPFALVANAPLPEETLQMLTK